MYSAIVHALQELKPPYILLVQACVIVFFPYFLWRICKLEKYFPLPMACRAGKTKPCWAKMR